jgi:hypothetical protein
MFTINNDKSIYLTRGDTAVIEIGAVKIGNESYIFTPGEVVRFKVCEKRRYDRIVLLKDVIVDSETEFVDITLTKDDTKIGELINKPEDYWYEVELNPNTSPQTIIGYDVDGPKIFRLFPEGDDVDEDLS